MLQLQALIVAHLRAYILKLQGVLWMSWRNGDSGTPMGQVSYFMDKIAQAENSY
jgi:hypothetical protein